MKKLLVCLVLVVVLAGCVESNNVGDEVDRIFAVPYKLVGARVYEYEYEGMPCLIVAAGERFGITCDWSKWDE